MLSLLKVDCENKKISIPGRDASRHLYCTFSAVCYVSDPRPSSSQCRLILATTQSCGLGKVLYNAISELIILFLVYKLNKNEVLYRVEVSLDGRNKCVSTVSPLGLCHRAGRCWCWCWCWCGLRDDSNVSCACSPEPCAACAELRRSRIINSCNGLSNTTGQARHGAWSR